MYVVINSLFIIMCVQLIVYLVAGGEIDITHIMHMLIFLLQCYMRMLPPYINIEKTLKHVELWFNVSVVVVLGLG